MNTFMVFLIVVVVLLLLGFSVRIVKQYERGVAFFLGKYWGTKGPGLVFVPMFVSHMNRVSLRTIAMSEGIEIKVTQEGKWKTAFQLCGLLGLLVHYRYMVSWGVVEVDMDFHRVGLWLLALSMAFSLKSAVDYFRSFVVGAAEHRAPT